MALEGSIVDLTVPSSGTVEKTFVINLDDLEAANTTNTGTITDAITTTENNLKTHNTDIETSLKTHNTNIETSIHTALGDTDTNGDIVTILKAFETNIETRLTAIDDRLNEIDIKYSKILGYSEDTTVTTTIEESIAGLIGDVTTLTGKADGVADDDLPDQTIVGALQTINNKIGDVSTLTNPVVNDNITSDDGEALEDLTITGIQQVINDKIGVPEEIELLVGEVVDIQTGTILSPGIQTKMPKSIAGMDKGVFLSSQENWVVDKDLRRRFANITQIFIDAFNKMTDSLMKIAPISPRT